MAKEYKYKNYTFYSEAEFKNAQKENEAIEYVKSKTDMGNIESVVSLYNKLVERKLINTPIGLDFLKMLREKALNSNVVAADSLLPLPEIKLPSKKSVIKVPGKTELLLKENRNLKFIIGGLILIIIAMFIIVLTGKSSPIKRVYEQDVLNKYASWKQELDDKQEEIDKQLHFLEQNGIYFDTEDAERGK